ncbi:hypothetical protein BZA77DRAFT_355641 [Pyronema omphalodes]|nr:hypothetical protein BZA77DRAFT_355641 [Pyronema omphalodes]
MPSQNNSSPPMSPRPLVSFGSLNDNMDVDAPVPQQQPPPQQMNGFFQGFVQASSGPQSAIPADIQYSGNSDPAPTPERQSPIDNMATPTDMLLDPLQRMNISSGYLSGQPSGLHNEMSANIQYSRNSDPTPTLKMQSPIDNMATPTDKLLAPLQRMNISSGYLSGEPSGLHNEIPANIQNIHAAHVPPVSTFNVVGSAMGNTTNHNQMRGDAESARIEVEASPRKLEKRLWMKRQKQRKPRIMAKQVTKTQDDDENLPGGPRTLYKRPPRRSRRGKVYIYNGSRDQIRVDFEKIRDFAGFRKVLIDQWDLKLPSNTLILTNHITRPTNDWSKFSETIRRIDIIKVTDIETYGARSSGDKFVIECLCLGFPV